MSVSSHAFIISVVAIVAIAAMFFRCRFSGFGLTIDQPNRLRTKTLSEIRLLLEKAGRVVRLKNGTRPTRPHSDRSD